MGPFSGARWTRSQSAPPCPGAWSYRILGRFPLPATNVERQQQQQQEQEQQVAVPQAGQLRNDIGISVQPHSVQLHPPGCCVHPQYGYMNYAPQEAPAVPVDAVHNRPICPGTSSRLHISANPNSSRLCISGYPPQYPIRGPAHMPTPHDTRHQPPQPQPQAHSQYVYPPPPPPGHPFAASNVTLVGGPQRPGVVHSHSYSGCPHPHPHHGGEYRNPHGSTAHNNPQQQHQHPQEIPSPGIPQGPTWNAVNSKRAEPGSRDPHAQPAGKVPLEGQGTFERPFTIHTPAEGQGLVRASGRSYPHSTVGSTTVGTGSFQAEDSPILSPSSPTSILQLQALAQPQPVTLSDLNTRINALTSSTIKPPSSAPKRTRKSYTREYKLKALNLLNSERPDGKGGMVPASDTWVSRQVGVTRKVLRGWKAQEERLRASRKGSRRVRVGRNRERRSAGTPKDRSPGDKGKGKEIKVQDVPSVDTPGEGGVSRGTPNSPREGETSSEDEDAEICTPAERHSTEDIDEDEGDNDDMHRPRTSTIERQEHISCA